MENERISGDTCKRKFKRIPNKTLRLVNNHPLIYYVIKTLWSPSILVGLL